MTDQTETQIDADDAVETSIPAQDSAATIGVFDSGIGGFTVGREVLQLRPDLNLVYFGDSINVPYGDKSPEQLSRMAKNSIEFLKSMNIDILAVGCNASNSVLGQGELKSFGLPVYDLVSSTVSYLKELDEPPESLALVATVASINSGYWQRKLADALPKLSILEIPAPRFVPLVENELHNETAISESVAETLQICNDQDVNTILHGCTHYPFMQDAMQTFNPEFTFIDPAVCLAKKLCKHLSPAQSSPGSGKRKFFCSLPTEVFYQAGEAAFGFPIRNLTSMYIVNPFED